MIALRNRRVLVMGLGRFGGGVGVSRWLVEQGARVTVTDLADERALRDSVAALDGLAIRFRLGGHREEDLDQTDALVVNPAVDKARSDFFQAAAERGIPWTTEMNLFLERCPARVVGVTGTAGKSTTCAMVHHVLAAAVDSRAARLRRAWLGGNIGRSLLSELGDMTAQDVVVLEMSSFQLEDVAQIRRSPAVAAILNVSPNHLDRHGSQAAYLSAKLNIMRFQKPGDCAVVGPEDRTLLGQVVEIADQTGARVLQASGSASYDLGVPGRHNQMNASCADAICTTVGINGEAMRGWLATYRALPHRLQFVRTFQGAEYYNDSKSTTPQATVTAVQAFDQPLILILGGYDKGLPLEEMAGVLAERAKAVVCAGAAGARYAEAILRARGAEPLPVVERTGRLAEATGRARELAEAGDVILLSPGCSSFDQFANYECRGQAFMDQVNAWSV